jgi:uncharacterized membrane protein
MGRFILSLTVIVLATDLAILIDIPVFGQIAGFLVFTVLPGLIILSLLKLNRLPPTETIVLSIGLGIAFLMLLGLFLDGALTVFGYAAPLYLFGSIALTLRFDLLTRGILRQGTQLTRLY